MNNMLNMVMACMSLMVATSVLHSQSMDDSIRIYNEHRAKLDKSVAINKDVIIQLNARLGDAYLKTGDLDKAEAAYLDGMALIETTSGRYSELSPWLIVRLARVYRLINQVDLAWDMINSVYHDSRSNEIDNILLVAMLHHERGVLAIARSQDSEYRPSNSYYSYGTEEGESHESYEYNPYSEGNDSQYELDDIRSAMMIRDDELSPATLLSKSYTLYQKSKRVPAAQVAEVVFALNKLNIERGFVSESISLLQSFYNRLASEGDESEKVRYETQGELANVLLKAGRFSESLEQYESLVQRTKGDSFEEVSSYITALVNLSELYALNKNGSRALEVGKRAQEAAASLFGATSIRYADILSCVVTAQLQIGDTIQAAQILNRQYAILVDSAQSHSTLFVKVSRRLGDLYCYRSELVKAEAILQSAIKASTDLAATTEYGMMLITLAEVRSKLGNDVSADSLLTQGVTILSSSNGRNESYGKGLLLAARIKDRLEQYEEATEYYESALTAFGRRLRYGEPTSDTISLVTTIIQRLIHLYVKTNRENKALSLISAAIELGEKYESISPHMMFRYSHLYYKIYTQGNYNQRGYRYKDQGEDRNDSDASKIIVYMRELYGKLDTLSLEDRISMSEAILEHAAYNYDYARADSALSEMIHLSEESKFISADTLINYHTLRAIYRSKAHDTSVAQRELTKATTYISKLSKEDIELALARIDRANGEYFLETKQLDSARACFERSIESYGLLRSSPTFELGQAYLGNAAVSCMQEDYARASMYFKEAENMGVRICDPKDANSVMLTLAYARSLSSISDFNRAYAAYKSYVKYLQQRDGRYAQTLIEPLKEMLNIVHNTSYGYEKIDIDEYINQIDLGPNN